MSITPSTFSVTKQIINESGFGLNGLNRGFTATVARNGVFNMIYFGFYHSVKEIVPEYKVGERLFNLNSSVFSIQTYGSCNVFKKGSFQIYFFGASVSFCLFKMLQFHLRYVIFFSVR
jgi:hypothetical protein